MRDYFTRTLRRRGVYTGTTKGWTLEVPAPLVYFVINRRGAGMVRVEAGWRSRAIWIDWGKQPGA